jgi:uncharacterized protein YjbI with pentapeptide repeats
VNPSYKARWLSRSPDPNRSSPFGVTANGLGDYRGAPLSSLGTIERIAIHANDFSMADFQNLRITGCFFQNCVFDRADLRHVVIRSSQFENCSFQGADLRVGQIGIAGSVFNRCAFDGARVARAGFHNPVFEDTMFEGPDWKNVDFRAAGFWNCAFRGDLRGVMFRGDYQYPTEREINGEPKRTGLHRVSFGEAELFWVGFSNGCVLDEIVLPQSGSAFVCQIEPLLKCEAELAAAYPAEIAKQAAKYFDIIRVHVPQQDQIVSRNDLVAKLGAKNGFEVYEVMKRHLAERVS